jgi:hypothetical protein
MLSNINIIHELLSKIQEPVTCYHNQCPKLIKQMNRISSECIHSASNLKFVVAFYTIKC